MLDSIIIFFLQNILILTLIFWALSFVGTKFFQERHFHNSVEFFECGFYSFESFNLKFNFNFLIIINLLILYDVEFLFIVPYFYNYQHSTTTTIILLLVFLLFVIITLLFEWNSIVPKWSL